jgi:hypothetical protein
MKYLNKILVIMICMMIADCLLTRDESTFQVKISSKGEPEVTLFLKIFYSKEANYELKLTGDENNIIKVNGLDVGGNNALEIPFVIVQSLNPNSITVHITLYNGVNLTIEKIEGGICQDFTDLKNYLKRSYFMAKTRYIICQKYKSFNDKSHFGANMTDFRKANTVITNFQEDLKNFLQSSIRNIKDLGQPYSEYANYVAKANPNISISKTSPILQHCNKLEKLTVALTKWVNQDILRPAQISTHRFSRARLQHPRRSLLDNTVNLDKINIFPKLPEIPGVNPYYESTLKSSDSLDDLIKELETEITPQTNLNGLSNSQQPTPQLKIPLQPKPRFLRPKNLALESPNPK